MILTITPNPAVDVTYRTGRVQLGEVNRVQSVTETAGGKGVNVARVLAQLGHPVVCSGFLGGDNGAVLQRLLTGSGVDQRWLPVEQNTRRTTAVVSDDGATVFNEPGPQLGPDAWPRLTAHVSELLEAGDVVVVSGSTPPGTHPDDVPQLIAAGHARGARSLVDTSGPALLLAAQAGADLLKPNAAELLAATGAQDVDAGAAHLLELGARAVVVSCGEQGLRAFLDDGERRHAWRVPPAEVLSGNPTGAGDAAVAALALALAGAADGELHAALPTHLADAVALSGAAVLAPVAGQVDLTAYRRMRAAVTVEKIDAVG